MLVSCDVLTRSEAFVHLKADKSAEVDTNVETPNHNFTSLPCTTSGKTYLSWSNCFDFADTPHVHFVCHQHLSPHRVDAPLCYSAAEYACPVWSSSTHAHKLNPALHECCRIISGCLKPTNLDSVHLLAGIAPPHIRRTVACRMERTRQTTDARHQLFHHQPAASRLKSRKSFMRTFTPPDSSASSSRLQLWKDSLTDVPSSVKMAGYGEDCWRVINRLRTGVGRAKTMMRRWGYLDHAQSVDCDCVEPQTMAHLLSCRLLDEACTADDLLCGHSDRAGKGMPPQVGEQ